MCSFSSHFLCAFRLLAQDLCESNQNQVRTSMAPPRARRRTAKRTARGRTASPKRTWNVYISRSLKSINNHMSMSGRTMKIVNSFVNDLFERIASEAATVVRVNKKRTLGARELQTAVRLVLPADLAKHAMAEGTKAVSHASC
ncbi:putative Core histone H2A/H2B/H3/H4 [Trypanosoma cruzi]|nr:putative Core histone H2A/H2B/H3/H4 [Trypanosoma cruzi]